MLPLALLALAQTLDRPVRSVTDPGVVTTRQLITPAGVPSVFQGRVYGVAFGAAADELWVLHATHLYRLNWRENRVVEKRALPGSPGLQALAVVDGQPVIETMPRGAAKDLPGALAANATKVLIPAIGRNELIVREGAKSSRVKTGIAPFGVAMNAAGTIAYVTNWGGREAKPGETTAPTGLAADADQVVVDARGIASTGTVTRVDLTKLAVTHTIPVGLHPMAIIWDEDRGRVYVANGNSDTVSVIDSASQRVVSTVAMQPFSRPVRGIAPTALALAGDRLLVACGGINAVVAVNTKTLKLEGSIPTAWYPNALIVAPDGKRFAVASLLGAGSAWRDDPKKRFVHSYRGSVAVVDLPDAAQLASYSAVVAENNRIPAQALPARKGVAPLPVPERAGEPSLIEHVVFVVKENRTYDQVFGDIAKGNGDPSLVMFGRDATPNHHNLAERFVLLDNFYATGGNSADGHQWLTQANEVAYTLWPGYSGRSYPFDGTDPIAYSDSGFLWDAALKAGRTVKIYGEYAGRLAEPNAQRHELLEGWKRGEKYLSKWNTVAPIAPLNKLLAANYPAYTNAIPDVVRADIFNADVTKWVADGKMPNLVVLQLPSDHTFGASPGASSPRAMVADNDLAVGRVVEALTKTPFWEKMAIFIVEDDAQNGVDHVDGHRTVALAISPYVKRGHVDSTFYSHQSMLKTIELQLGMPALSLFDLIALDMRASFTNEPDFTPYTAVEPQQSLFERNPERTALRGQARKDAIASAKMRWDVPDAAPTDKVNRILWRMLKGTPYPGVKSGVFAPLSLDIDDDDR
ncbi:MAG: bifunctional YncE family protein/alkaline phosphatase family protein [Bryobacteraceae bacterium]|nr:bifunctional YncE family protein/alkaline phosphatase family protein [Bryobacteraceae bacterium]